MDVILDIQLISNVRCVNDVDLLAGSEEIVEEGFIEMSRTLQEYNMKNMNKTKILGSRKTPTHQTSIRPCMFNLAQVK